MITKRSVVTFLKAQVSAFSGGLADYGLMILFTEVVNIHFAVSILISGTIGGIINFCINRYWAFKTTDQYSNSAKGQLVKFFAVVLGSITLKSAGTLLLKLGLNIDYKIGRLAIDALVSYGFNYPLMKFWVFRAVRN